MIASNLVLIAGAGGVGRTVLDQLRAQDLPVRAMVRRDDDRAAELRALGAEVVLGDLTRPESVAAALEGVGRMYFAMPVSPDHLLAATVVATVAREHGQLAGLAGMSQMTVSQMTATSTAESHQQRLHWLAEQVLNWSSPVAVDDVARVVASVPDCTARTATDRASDDVERVTGVPPQTIEAFVAGRRDFYLG
jgi:uncharacterized protein YbjT (DUF2867 family)